jgi:hypothetical protein
MVELYADGYKGVYNVPVSCTNREIHFLLGNYHRSSALKNGNS